MVTTPVVCKTGICIRTSTTHYTNVSHLFVRDLPVEEDKYEDPEPRFTRLSSVFSIQQVPILLVVTVNGTKVIGTRLKNLQLSSNPIEIFRRSHCGSKDTG